MIVLARAVVHQRIRRTFLATDVNTEVQTGDVPAAKQVVQVSDVIIRQINL